MPAVHDPTTTATTTSPATEGPGATAATTAARDADPAAPATTDPRPGPAAFGDPGAFPATLTVHRWPDPVLDAVGHDPRSPYVERFWLPVLGPSAVWLLRRLADELDTHPDGVTLAAADVARSLGVGSRGGRQSPFARTVERVVSFGFAQQVGDAVLHVRHHLPPLSRRQLQRLPIALQHDHDLWIERDAAEPPVAAQRRRARALALSLLQLGEAVETAERQLHRWRFHPAIAHEAVRWAQAQAAVPPPAGPPHPGGSAA